MMEWSYILVILNIVFLLFFCVFWKILRVKFFNVLKLKIESILKYF